MWHFWTKQWFLVAIAAALGVGYVAAEALEPLRRSVLFRDSVVWTVMFLMGITLSPAAIRRSLRHPVPALLALLINIVGVPLLAIPTYWLLGPEWYGGLVVATLVPCTLASASVWTRRAGGDDSIAILTTVVTNLACVVVLPYGTYWMLATSGIEVSPMSQMRSLAIIVVLPLVFAQVARRLGADVWADRKKIGILLVAQFGILIMVTLGAAAGRSSMLEPAQQSTAIEFVTGSVAAIVIHVIALAIGIAVSRAVGANRQEQIAVGISGSQKTLMVGLQIAISAGVSVLPMIVYHVAQLVIDTVVVDRWRQDHASDT
jgi:sodium/bile acid cotransporter 7